MIICKMAVEETKVHFHMNEERQALHDFNGEGISSRKYMESAKEE